MTITNRRAVARIHLLVAVCVTAVAGCATRPPPEVLNPVPLDQTASDRAVILSATNRNQEAAPGRLTSMWAEKMTYERYEFSVPSNRKDTAVTYPTPKPDPGRQFLVTERTQLSEHAFKQEVMRAAQFDGTIGIFVHGYNYSYQEALFRMAQIAADAKMPDPPILFSWPSAAAVAGYVADRDASLYSRSDLYSLLNSLSSPKVKRIILFGHSMGGFLVMETVRQLKFQGRDDIIDKLTVILGAPDIDVDVFRSQLKDIGKMRTPITLLVSKDDRALTASSFIAGERLRVGRLDISDPIIEEAAQKERLRVIDITSVRARDGLGHDRYASLAKFGAQLAAFETSKRPSSDNVGSFVFDAAGAVAASPLHLVKRVVGSP